MSMLYPTPVLEGITDIFGYANLYTGGFFSPLMIIVIWGILYFIMVRRWETEESFAGATGAAFLISIPLAFIKFQGDPILNPFVVVTLMILFGITAIMLWWND